MMRAPQGHDELVHVIWGERVTNVIIGLFLFDDAESHVWAGRQRGWNLLVILADQTLGQVIIVGKGLVQICGRLAWRGLS